MRRKLGILATTITTLSLLACTQEEPGQLDPNSSQNQIVASIEKSVQTRTAVGTSSGSSTTILWTSGDRLGVFDATGASQTCYTKIGSGAAATASFTAVGSAIESPVYAYYPYSAANDGVAATSLTGTVPAMQDMTDGTLKGDYKVGSLVSSSTQGHSFSFTHLFAVGSVVVDASGTPLTGESLEQVTISVTASDGTAVPIAGDFSFDATATQPSYTKTGTSATAINLTWAEGSRPSLATAQTCHAVFFPEATEGSTFTIEVLTQSYRAEFTSTCKVNMQAGAIYDFPVSINQYETLKVYDRTSGDLLHEGIYTDSGDSGDTGDSGILTGTFTCATLNVDGLPSIINSGGPGSSGTTQMGNIINNLGWDFVGVSENFEYNEQLVAAMSNYSNGTYRGTVSLTGSDTDGLGFFWRSSVSVAGESCTAYNDEIGGLSDGANTLISKGFRHYEVTVATGMTVDVYITHMNTWSDSKPTEYEAVQIAQLCQLRDAVVAAAKTNNRPAIIMGDTNMRYTRHAIKTNFFDAVAAEGLEANDPWVALHRGGTYPTYETKSLMIQSMYKGDTENDFCCSDEQRGEVVDKIWYINVPGASLQLTATSSQNDLANFTESTESASYTCTYEDANGTIHENYPVSYTRSVGYADHFPVVVEFSYTYTPTDTAN